MRILLPFVIAAVGSFAETPAAKLWTDLAAKRAAHTRVHQEFDVSRVARLRSGDRTIKARVTLDFAGAKWSEKYVSGSSTRTTMFDGENLFLLDERDEEFERLKRPKDAPDLAPYLSRDADWSRGVEGPRKPCDAANITRLCVTIEAPLRPAERTFSSSGSAKRVNGNVRVMFDLETGLALVMRSSESIQGESTPYPVDMGYVQTNTTVDGPVEEGLFKLPSAAREVKEFSKWSAARIRKELVGKPAPDLVATDMKGDSVKLSTLKGRVVLIDFWATWCPPCRADAPALDKLYAKYAAKDLAILGICVNEERAVVEPYLNKHPHPFPIVLTSENEMPLMYRVSSMPTYIIIDKDGTVAGAVQGDQGFGEIRKQLKKAGME